MKTQRKGLGLGVVVVSFQRHKGTFPQPAEETIATEREFKKRQPMRHSCHWHTNHVHRVRNEEGEGPWGRLHGVGQAEGDVIHGDGQPVIPGG